MIFKPIVDLGFSTVTRCKFKTLSARFRLRIDIIISEDAKAIMMKDHANQNLLAKMYFCSYC